MPNSNPHDLGRQMYHRQHDADCPLAMTVDAATAATRLPQYNGGGGGGAGAPPQSPRSPDAHRSLNSSASQPLLRGGRDTANTAPVDCEKQTLNNQNGYGSDHGKLSEERTSAHLGSGQRERYQSHDGGRAHEDDLDANSTAPSSSLFARTRRFITSDQPADWTNARLQWDALKTATPTRRFALHCLSEVCGSWLFSLGYHGALYSAIHAWIFIEGVSGVDVAAIGLWQFAGFSLSLWFALIIFGPVGEGAHFVPQVTLGVVMLGIYPIWKAPFIIAAQCLGFWSGQITAILIEYDLFRLLKEQAMAMGGREMFFATGNKFGGKSIAQLVVYTRLAARSWWPMVVGEIVLNFIMALIIAATVDHSNPLSSPSSSPWPIAAGGGFILTFFGLDGMVTHSFRWTTGFSCWILFGIDKRCFPGVESVFSALAPLVGMPIGFVFYALFVADTRRPAASALLSQVDAQVSEMAAKAAAKQMELLEKRGARKSARRRRRWSRRNHDDDDTSVAGADTTNATVSESMERLQSLSNNAGRRSMTAAATLDRNVAHGAETDGGSGTGRRPTSMATTTTTTGTSTTRLHRKVSFGSLPTADSPQSLHHPQPHPPPPLQRYYDDGLLQQQHHQHRSGATSSHTPSDTAASPTTTTTSSPVVMQGQAITADFPQQRNQQQYGGGSSVAASTASSSGSRSGNGNGSDGRNAPPDPMPMGGWNFTPTPPPPKVLRKMPSRPLRQIAASVDESSSNGGNNRGGAGGPPNPPRSA